MPERRWWDEPFRVFQTNLREIDAGLDVGRVVGRIAELGASAWLLNTAGIVSFYPSKLAYQHPSPWLRDRPSGDLIGDAIPEAHAHYLDESIDYRALDRILDSVVREREGLQPSLPNILQESAA